VGGGWGGGKKGVEGPMSAVLEIGIKSKRNWVLRGGGQAGFCDSVAVRGASIDKVAAPRSAKESVLN